MGASEEGQAGLQPSDEAVIRDDAAAPAAAQPVKIAVFDFDGTCIDGKSPVLLMVRLGLARRISPWVITSVILWGLGYKMNLPLNEQWVRSQIFKAFEGLPREEVDEYLTQFYDERVETRFRPYIAQRIKELKDEGYFILAISAGFEPVVRRMGQTHLFDDTIATAMVIDENGNYTNQVDGVPAEGEQKVVELFLYADEKFGQGNWELSYAYCDHSSDEALLSFAEHPVAVCPSPHLRRRAEQEGWEILDL